MNKISLSDLSDFEFPKIQQNPVPKKTAYTPFGKELRNIRMEHDDLLFDMANKLHIHQRNPLRAYHGF